MALAGVVVVQKCLPHNSEKKQQLVKCTFFCHIKKDVRWREKETILNMSKHLTFITFFCLSRGSS